MMNSAKHGTLLVALIALGAVGALGACGELTDPSKAEDTSAARVSGALSGPASSNLRVAVVWKAGKDGGHRVAQGVAVVDGRFSLDVAPPPNEYLGPIGEESRQEWRDES